MTKYKCQVCGAVQEGSGEHCGKECVEVKEEGAESKAKVCTTCG